MTTTHDRPVPLGSLTAAAQRITKQRINPGTQVGTGRTASPAQDTTWQADAWEAYDLLGELRFTANVIATHMSAARFYVGRIPEDQTDDPIPVDDPRVTGILASVGDGPKQLAQMVTRLGLGLQVPGEAWLAAVPSRLVPASQMTSNTLDASQVDTPATSGPVLDGSVDLDDLHWRALSTDEVRFPEEGKVELALGGGPGDKITVDIDEVLLIRVWRPHPRLAWEADSPTRSSLPVLRELIGLTMHISAQIDSRLSGAGMLIVPASVQQALRSAYALSQGVPADQVPPDVFTEALMQAMLEPIRDRGSASAVVPLVVTAPDEAADLFRHVTFAQPLDEAAPGMREEAIRRFALGIDAPPELLLGTSGASHWSAWLVREDVVTTHLEPPLALICDALTVQFLWPVLMSSLGMSEAEARRHVIWYEVEHLITRPNHSADALELFDRGIISAEAVRRATGFEESDAPGPGEVRDRLPAPSGEGPPADSGTLPGTQGDPAPDPVVPAIAASGHDMTTMMTEG